MSLLDLADQARRLAESSYGVAQERLLSLAREAEAEAAVKQAASGSARDFLRTKI